MYSVVWLLSEFRNRNLLLTAACFALRACHYIQVPDLPDPDGANAAGPGRLLPHLPLPVHAVRRRCGQQQRQPQADGGGARDGDVAPDVRDGVVQGEGGGVDSRLARPADGRVARAGRRRLAQAPARRPPRPPLLRRPPRSRQEMVIVLSVDRVLACEIDCLFSHMRNCYHATFALSLWQVCPKKKSEVVRVR